MGKAVEVIELGFVNAYLLEAEGGFVLIDTGMPAHWRELDRRLASAGCAPGRLRLVVATHGDWDHIGNCAKLRKKYRAPVALHAGDAAMAERPVVLKRRVRTLPLRIVSRLWPLIMRLRRDWPRFEPFQPDRLLSDGQSLREYGLPARIVHLPGHTRGSIGVLTEAGDLFAGDILVNRKRPGAVEIIEDDRQLEDSLARLRRMKIRTVYPGHGQPFAMSRWTSPGAGAAG